MLKPAPQTDEDLNKQAISILHKYGLTKKAYLRAALKALTQERIKSDAPVVKICLKPAIPAPAKAETVEISRIEKTKLLQAKVRQFLGGKAVKWDEADKKAFFDDLSGE